MSNNRWGFPAGYDQGSSIGQAVRKELQQPQVTPVVDKTAINAVTKSVIVLESIVQDLRVDNEKLKRENGNLSSTNNILEQKINTLEQQLKGADSRAEPYKSDTFATRYASGGFVGGNLCEEIAAPVFNKYHQGANINKPQTVGRVHQSASIAPSYEAPVNPMTVFVEFLEELDVFQEYYDITDKDGISFELLCNQYNPSDWISEVCTDDDGDFLDEWAEADELWIAICEADSLDSKEAYIE